MVSRCLKRERCLIRGLLRKTRLSTAVLFLRGLLFGIEMLIGTPTDATGQKNLDTSQPSNPKPKGLSAKEQQL